MPFELFEYKSSALGAFSGKSGGIDIDQAQGVVECFVAGIGNKDSVGDIVASGAFTKSLQRRKPRVVWGHNWNDPIGKVLEIYEVPNTDPRLPMKMKMAGIGGLFARVQFNLQSEKGREAFANVAFFGEEQEWSIGYKTLRAQFDQKSQANVIYELELYEVSPVLHGANQLTGTISVKSDEQPMGMMMVDDEQPQMDRAEIEKQLSAILGTKVSVMDIQDDEITFARRENDGSVGKYKCHYGNNRGRFMFGTPEQIVVVAKPNPKPMGSMPGMPVAPVMPVGSPGMPMNEPQMIVRPQQMPSIPVAIKPGENGPQMIPLPRVEYDGQQESFDPENLDKEEADLRDALLKIVKRHGKFNEDSDGVWAGYKPAAQNPVAGIGVKCANCVFYQGGSNCKIIDMDVEPEGKCRFAVIPNGVVKGDAVAKKTYQIEQEVNEDDYLDELEVKYPGELAVAAVRGIIGRKKIKRRKYRALSEFGTKSEDIYGTETFVLPVMPQYAYAVKQAIDPILDFHMVESFVDEDGIVLSSGVTVEVVDAIDTAIENLKKKWLIDDGIEEKAVGYRLGRAIGSRLIDRPNIGGGRSARRFFTSPDASDFDPRTARDVDLDGIVGEGLFMRGIPLEQPDPTPDGPGSIRNPKPSLEQLKKPKERAGRPVGEIGPGVRDAMYRPKPGEKPGDNLQQPVYRPKPGEKPGDNLKLMSGGAELTPERLKEMTISEIAGEIRRDLKDQGKKMPFGAAPYVDAMDALEKIDDMYGLDTGKSIVAYALSNLTPYKGEKARAIKKELKDRLKLSSGGAELTPERLKEMTISEIAGEIRRDLRDQGKKMPFGAAPYVDAMDALENIDDMYGLDTGKSVVAYALSNLTTYKGDKARAIKKELKDRLKLSSGAGSRKPGVATKPRKFPTSELLSELPDISDENVSAMQKFTAAEQMREELQSVLDGADEPGQVRKLRQAINQLDQYTARIEKQVARDMPKATKKSNLSSAIEALSSGKNKSKIKFPDNPTPDQIHKDGETTYLWDEPSGKWIEVLEEDSPQIKDIYAELAKEVLQAMYEARDKGAFAWKMPWSDPEHWARNPVRKENNPTGRLYEGTNAFNLRHIKSTRQYPNNKWAGKTQWPRMGGKIKPGEKGTPVLVPRDGLTGRYYIVQEVFNAAQVSGLPPEMYLAPDVDINEEERLADIDTVLKEIGARIVEEKGSSAFYRPLTDSIHMPAFEQFVDALSFYGTMLHENVHWTSHPTRLNRELGRRMGDPKYAFEELIAEIGSAMAMGIMGLSPVVREDHALYLNHWIRAIQTDPTALPRAIEKAQQAVDYLMNRSATMRKLAGKAVDERKGKRDVWKDIPMIEGMEGAQKIPTKTEFPEQLIELLDMDEVSDGEQLYIDSELLKLDPTPGDTLNADELSSGRKTPDERMSSSDVIQRDESGFVYDSTNRLSSGKTAGPIKPKRGDGPEIKRTDGKIAFRHVYKGLSVEPTQQQRDIIDTALHLILRRDRRLMAINAGAGTGKTTTLKSISLALASEFYIDPTWDDDQVAEKLAHLSDKYDIDFSGMSKDEIKDAVKKLAAEFKPDDIYYAVFGKKNQKEAELDFPSNTGVATTSKIFWWSLALGQGDEKYGPGMRTKIEMISRGDGRIDRRMPKGKPIKYKGRHFDGTEMEFEGRKPGFKDLGYIQVTEGLEWMQFLRSKNAKGLPPQDGTITLPNGAQLTPVEFGDLLKKALRRWSLDVDEKVKKEHFELSQLEREQMVTTIGQKRKRRGEVSLVDADLDAAQIPDEWVAMVQMAVDEMMDGKSNLLPSDELAKLWMLTKPDLRTDPGLISHAARDKKMDVWVPDTTKVGDIVDIDGVEMVAIKVDNKRDAGGTRVKATLTKRYGLKNPIGTFMVDEAQDMNPIMEQVLQDNRDNVQIILVGDERQSILGFQDAKDILSSMNPEYSLDINESFRYGAIIAYLANIALTHSNIYRETNGEEQISWKHVKGLAAGVVDKDFSMKSVDGKGELTGGALETKIKRLAQKYPDDETKILSTIDMTPAARNKALDTLRKKYATRARGRVVDAETEIQNGNLPTMILVRNNSTILPQAIEFSAAFRASAKGTKKDGTPNIPDIVIPVKKHADLLAFMKHLHYIQLDPTRRAEWDRRYGGRPEQSKIIGNIWSMERFRNVIKQNQGSQMRALFNLVDGRPKPDGSRYYPMDFIRMLEGYVVKDTLPDGKEVRRVVPPTLIPERETVKLGMWFNDFDADSVMERASRPHSSDGPTVKKQSQREPWIVVPGTSNTKSPDKVMMRLELDGHGKPEFEDWTGSGNRPSRKWTGRIIIEGEGVDTPRPTILPNGEEKFLSYKRNGVYRRDVEKIIERHGLEEFVKPVENIGPITANNVARDGRRRPTDGFVIQGRDEKHSIEIAGLIGQELRDAAEGVGGDVEITTATLSKGRESDFIVIADDFKDPDEITPLLSLDPKGKLAGKPSKSFLEELNLIYVALTRAKLMIDPGNSLMKYYLQNPNVIDRLVKEIKERDGLDSDLDLSKEDIFPQELLDRVNKWTSGGGNAPGGGGPGGGGGPDGGGGPGGGGDDGGTPTLPSSPADEVEDDNTELLDPDDNESDVPPVDENDENEWLRENEGDNRDDDEEELDLDGIDDEDGDMPEMSLSSGLPGPRTRRSTIRKMTPQSSSLKRTSAQQLAGIRIDGDINEPRSQRILDYAMDVWNGIKKSGIAIDTDSTLTGDARKKEISSSMANVGKRMRGKQGVRIGRVSDNAGNQSPSAATWMLSAEKLADMIRIPTEFNVRNAVGENGEERSIVRWTQSRGLSMDELGDLLGLSPADKNMLKQPGAGVNHDAVRHLLSEMANEKPLSGWSLFGVVSADEMMPEGQVEANKPSSIDVIAENNGRANMRDRFIIETFGKDAFPHWFDPEENQSISPDEYESLGEVSERAKFRATGRFFPDSATRGDSEAEEQIFMSAIDEMTKVGVGVAPEPGVPEQDIASDMTTRKDFDVDSLIEHLGIDKAEWKNQLRDRLSQAFGVEPDKIGLGKDANWARDGVPIAFIDKMISTGVINSASDVWKEGSGERLDLELTRKKHVIYEAVNDFMQKAFGDRASKRAKEAVIGSTDVYRTLQTASSSRGSKWTSKKGDEPRFSTSDMQAIVDRMNERFDTAYTVEDIFSAEQLETARKRIEEEGKTSLQSID